MNLFDRDEKKYFNCGMMVNKEDIGKRIKQALVAAGKSQRDLAKALNIAESSVTAYVQGGSEPSAQGFAMIAELCEVTIDWLITGRASETKPPKLTQNEIMRAALKTAITGDRALVDEIRDSLAPYTPGGDSLTAEQKAEQKELLDLWAAADSDARDSAKYVLQKSADKSRRQEGGGSDLAGRNSA